MGESQAICYGSRPLRAVRLSVRRRLFSLLIALSPFRPFGLFEMKSSHRIRIVGSCIALGRHAIVFCSRELRNVALRIAGCLIAILFFAGCAGQKSWMLRNPFEGAPPEYKAQYGLTPAQKVDRLVELAGQIPGMAPARQATVCDEMIAALQRETDPMIRRELVRTIGAIGLPRAREGLALGQQDSHPSVRMAACEAWGRRDDPESAGALAAVLADDANVDVRLAASKALTRQPKVQAYPHLVASLQDRDPAVQLATMQALRETTGAELQDDVNKWIGYVQAQMPKTEGSSLPTHPVDLPGFPGFPGPHPGGPDDRASLASGIASSANQPTVQPPVYHDVSSGENVFP